jgi:hypothetical protein
MREIRTLRRDVEGAGNVVWSEYMAKSTRQSSTLPARGGRGNPVPYRYNSSGHFSRPG